MGLATCSIICDWVTLTINVANLHIFCEIQTTKTLNVTRRMLIDNDFLRGKQPVQAMYMRPNTECHLFWLKSLSKISVEIASKNDVFAPNRQHAQCFSWKKMPNHHAIDA